MPRSGTSLTEQIIASHPAAEGVGEPDFWLEAARAHHDEIRQAVLGLPARKKLAEDYLRLIERRYPDAPRIVDKTPANSDFVGIIHTVFPNARIIRMRRNPIDTCLSCYFQNFSTGMTFTMDLSDLADYYRIHERIMNHWCSALPPGTILEVPYEELVADQETWTRKILDFVGLEWDERCLAFHETKRSVIIGQRLAGATKDLPAVRGTLAQLREIHRSAERIGRLDEFVRSLESFARSAPRRSGAAPRSFALVLAARAALVPECIITSDWAAMRGCTPYRLWPEFIRTFSKICICKIRPRTPTRFFPISTRPCIGLIGLRNAALTLTVAFKIVFFAAAWVLARRLLRRRLRFLGGRLAHSHPRHLWGVRRLPVR